MAMYKVTLERKYHYREYHWEWTVQGTGVKNFDTVLAHGYDAWRWVARWEAHSAIRKLRKGKYPTRAAKIQAKGKEEYYC
jgi:hypothetical protein